MLKINHISPIAPIKEYRETEKSIRASGFKKDILSLKKDVKVVHEILVDKYQKNNAKIK